jgi:hypothetical protein
VRNRLIFAGAIFVGAAVAALVVSSLIEPPGPQTRHEAGVPPADASNRLNQLDFPTPCVGSESTMSSAESRVPFTLLEPHSDLASEANMSAVWSCAGDSVAMEYASGVAIYMMPNEFKDAEAVFQRMAALYPEFAVGKVRGHVASLIDPAKSTNGTASGGVDFIENGVRITVLGNGSIPLLHLVDVAESLS